MEVSSCFPERFLKLVGLNVNDKEICSNMPKNLPTSHFYFNITCQCANKCASKCAKGVPIIQLGVPRGASFLPWSVKVPKGRGWAIFQISRILGQF